MSSPDPSPVPLLDLQLQHDGIREEVAEAMSRVVESQRFILGETVEAFEGEMAEFLSVPHAVGCASGTDALLLPLMALEPKPGDEVILPAFTFFATAGAVWNAGFRPVFCDVDPHTFNVTPETVEAVWTERTRAIIPVHLFGQMAPMEGLNELACRKGAVVIEDAAQAIGARQRATSNPDSPNGEVAAGASGIAGAFSFFPTKNLGGFGDGGLVSARDPELAEKVAKLRVHGGRQMYHHEMVGTNSRLDALQAAVLSVKLAHLADWTDARRANACRYHERLAQISGLELPVVMEGNWHVYNQFTIRVRDRDGLRAALAEEGIGTGVYYPVPLNLQPCFSELGGHPGQLPESERACSEVLSLPIFPELREEQIDRVAEAIRRYLGA
ncbi:MAG: DegT/DnrJ/EryC1/StrS family aminotransferase [Gemmatimonadales bacterium]|nr:MAG: DegT/DnrJ/EryC1/StrS family aminotransferase [Gemmatimonadales bacterium]